jgi:sugar phosphate permease
VFARDILHVGAPGQGVLLTAMGVGAFCSSVVVAALGSRLPRGLLMLGGVILYGVTVVLFANSPSFPLSVALMVIAGLFHVSTHTMTQIVVQAYTPAELRGRTMALLQQTHVVQMGGGLLLGAMATLAGAPLAITVMAAAGTIIAAVIFVAVPGARRIR